MLKDEHNAGIIGKPLTAYSYTELLGKLQLYLRLVESYYMYNAKRKRLIYSNRTVSIIGIATYSSY